MANLSLVKTSLGFLFPNFLAISDELDLVFDILFPTGDDPREWSTISDFASMANSVVGVEVEQDPEALPLLSNCE